MPARERTGVRRWGAFTVLGACVGACLVACGGAAPRVAAPRALRPTTVALPVTGPPAPTTTAAPTTVTTAPVATEAPTTVAPPTTSLQLTTTTTTTTTTSTTSAPPAVAGVAVPQLAGVTSSSQAIVVAAAGYRLTSAVLTAYQRVGSGWRIAFGPWTAYVGYNGFAPPGAKREGDGRTPSGTYGFGFFFGVNPDPGVHFAYRRVTGPNIVWDDDPASRLYNQWVDSTEQAAGANPEPMDVQPNYDYGAVIAYNTAATPGLGSAIFLHVARVAETTGCVALAAADLVPLLTWLQPAARPVIVMGVFG